jgi:pyruvate dehydrogenase E2 component (dihydrolipoamide acetyltransferase)
MPRLSDSMQEGTIIQWLVESGAEVARGDEIVEIETDKATMAYEAPTGGYLHVVEGNGTTVAVGETIARIVVDRAELDALALPQSAQAPVSPRDDKRADEPAAASTRERPAASPVARRLADERGVDLAALTGSGPGGRIVREDVERAAASQPAEGPDSAKGGVTVQTLSRTQQLVARRMAESKATVPEFTLTTEVDMEAAGSLREQLKGTVKPLPSYNDLIIKACAMALSEHPRANGAYRDGKFELYDRVNIGMAVAAPDSLVVPTVLDADKQSIVEIAAATRRLVERVRSNEVTPPELSGGTFTVSNLGMFGVSHFTAVINPPQAAILAVGAITRRPVEREGQIVIRPVMDVTLACDHRILYGAEAASFLARIREFLEHPSRMLLES